MSSKKGGGGGRKFSNAAPTMRREGAAGGSSRGRGGSSGGRGGRGGRGGARMTGMAAQAAVHGDTEQSGSKKRVRSSRAQNAFGYDATDWDGESAQHQAQRYESEASKSREYTLPENFEDEELDSDEEGIFNEDDEIKYGDVFAKKKGGGGSKPAAAAAKGKRGAKKSTASTEDDDEAEVSGDAAEGSDEEEDVSGWAGAETINLSDMIDWDEGKGKMRGEDEEDEEEDQAEEPAPPAKKARKAPAAAASAPAATKGKKLTRKQQQALDDAAAAAEAEEEEDEDIEEAEEDEDDQDDGEEERDGAEDDEEDEEEISMDDEDDHDAGGDAHKSLLKFVQGLKSSDDSADLGADLKAGKRSGVTRTPKGLQERNEAFEEGLFSIPKTASAAAAAAGSSTGLKLSDLLKKMPAPGGDDSAAGGDSSSLAALKKQLQVLSNSAHTKTLAEPLPEIRQEELTRSLGYAKTKEEVARWTPLINRLRDAPSVSFPLNAPPRENASSAALQTRFSASADSSLETDLASLMSSYGLQEKDLLRSESTELAAAHLTPEEISKRSDSLAKMKALLFYQEQKMARINRIKSKTYRRLKKKAREKGKLSLEEMKELDPEAYEAEQRKMETKRIEERMSLSHSNSSKWMAKQLQLNKAQRNANADIRDALTENNRIAQELRQKQESFPKQLNSEGEEEEDESDLSDDEEDEEDQEDEDEEAAEARAQAKAASRASELRAKLAELESSLADLDQNDEPAPGFDQAPGSKAAAAKAQKKESGGGVLGLKFMQKALEKQRAEARASIAATQAELAQEEAREALRRKQRRAGEEEMDDEELDVVIASSMPAGQNAQAEHDAASKAAQLAGRKKVAQNSTRALVAAAPEETVKLLPNSMQSAAKGAKGSKTRVDGPIAVPMPASVGKKAAAAAAAAAAALSPKNAHPGQHHLVHGKSTAAADTPFISSKASALLFPADSDAAKKAAVDAAVLATKNAHPGQHHLVHGKSTAAVDTPFISTQASQLLFPLEAFSDDDEDDAAAKGPNARPVDLNKIKSDVRASLQASKKAAAKAGSAVRVGGLDAEQEASEDEDLDAGAGDLPSGSGSGAGSAKEASANPWAQSSAVNPRKAARQAAKVAKRQKTGKSTAATAAADEDEEDDEEDAEATGASAIDMDLSRGGVALRSKRGEFDLASGGLSQAELVRRAFSAQADDEDNNGGAVAGVESAEAEFERLKRELTEEDLPKEDTPIGGLPGWGAWGGLGASNWKSPAQLKKEAAEKARRDARRADALSSRKDAKLKHVILNEKADAKAVKYLVASLPYPFTSIEQYERSLATPLGKEWNTVASFQQKTKPAVITKPGEIIEPAKYNPKVGAGAKTAAKKKAATSGAAAASKQPRSISGGGGGQKRKR